MSKDTVDNAIRALPVLKRYASGNAVATEMPSVSAAAIVATLPEPVKDIILGEHTSTTTSKPRRRRANGA